MYVHTAGISLSLDGDAICVRKDNSIVQRFPLVSVSGVVAFRRVGLSNALLIRLAEDGKTVFMLSGGGKVVCKMESPVGRSVPLRIQQFGIAASPDLSIVYAKKFVHSKVQGQERELYRLSRSPAQKSKLLNINKARTALTEMLPMVSACTDVNTLMGWEGQAARIYFNTWGSTLRPIRENRPWITRSRRPPRSPEDALLSFAYTMLYQQTWGSVETAGLDPYIGFLHKPQASRAALALDLMEDLRPRIVDSWVSVICARRELRVEHFESPDGLSFLLSDVGRGIFLRLWQEHMDSTTKIIGFKQAVPLRYLVAHRGKVLAKSIRDTTEYTPLFSKRIDAK